MSPQRIIGDFGGQADATRRGVRAMVEAALRDEGCSSFSHPSSLISRPSSLALDRLARHYGVHYDSSRPEIVLFAVQTWYLLLVKLLAGHVLAAVRGRKSPAAEAAAGDAHAVIGPLMHGGVFADLAATDPWPGEPFDWFVRAWTADLERAAGDAAAIISAYDPAGLAGSAAAGGDLLKPLYETLFPRTVRHALGEYYTPGWLAEHVLDQVGYSGQGEARVLDPTCGSGTFLLAALRRWRQGEGAGSWEQGVRGCSQLRAPCSLPFLPVVGFDLHPLAVAAARANYLLAVADLIPAEVFIEIPVYARDAILNPWPEPAGFDFVVGNPPWIAWDNLPGEYREATKPHWQRYGLFSLSGNEARHGGGKKDLSMLLLYSSADRYLRDGGQLGMVITQTLFQSKGAGDGFRRFQLGAGAPLGVLRVDDMADVRPFDAANWTSVIVLQKGRPTAYPVPYVKWKADAEGRRLPAANKIELRARPIDVERPTSPWIVGPAEIETRSVSEDPHDASLTLRVSMVSLPIARSDYTAHLGANSGGANAVYWLDVQGAAEGGVRVCNRADKAKRAVERVRGGHRAGPRVSAAALGRRGALVRAALRVRAPGPGPGGAGGHRRRADAPRLSADAGLPA